jgi:hypothetical protein
LVHCWERELRSSSLLLGCEDVILSDLIDLASARGSFFGSQDSGKTNEQKVREDPGGQREPRTQCDPGSMFMITIFCDFRQFSAKKLAFFSKTNVMIKFLQKVVAV